MTFLAHALALRAQHGPGPWPDEGHPLPDGEPSGPPGAVLSAAEIADLVTAPGGCVDLDDLHDRLADQPALRIADDLVTELRERRPDRVKLREVARWLAGRGTRRDAVKIGIVLLGVCGDGDPADRDLLLALGTLGELTRYAVDALMSTQADGRRTVFELARRVGGWGRIHAVQRLGGTTDPEIKGWLLREGFRNGVMDEYLAHLAATTGDLHTALLAPKVDDALFDGAGGILAALARGGPAQDMHDYPDAVPAMDRFAFLAAGAEPTLERLSDVLAIAQFVQAAREPEWLVARYEALLARPAWRVLVLSSLAHPVGPYGFNEALSCAGMLGIDALPQALAHLDRHPYANYVWHWALRHAGATTVATVIEHADHVLPGAGKPADRRLEVLVNGLERHPGHGLSVIGAALAHPIARVRRRAIKTLLTWPPEHLPQRGLDLVAAAAAAEPDDELRGQMTAFLAHTGPALG